MSAAPPPAPQPAEKAEAQPRRFWFNAAGLVVACAAVVAALALWLNSARFQNMVRQWLITDLQKATGGRVELGSFSWHLFRLEVEASGLVIHGDEPANEAPYARIDRLRAQISVLGFWWSPRIVLRDLEITRPQFHLILYPDGMSNQPHPARPRKSSGSGMDTLFNLQAGHVAVENGLIDLDDRAADNLDAQNRFQPLDFDGDDISLVMRYVPPDAHSSESYRIETSATDLTLARSGTLAGKVPPVHGYLHASLDLTHDAAFLRSVRLTARAKNAPDRTIDITGALTHFAQPEWQLRVNGDLDLHLLDPLFGYPFAPEGIAKLDLAAGGKDREFHIDGTVHVEKAAYVGTGVDEHGIDLNTRVHADRNQLHITSITARLPQGGEIDGELLLQGWLPVSIPVVMEAAPPPAAKPHTSLRKRLGHVFHPEAEPPRRPSTAPPHSTLVKAPPSMIPVNGRVDAVFKNVSVDTVLDMVSQPPYKRLGVDALLNGPATATWTHGDERTLAVEAKFGLTPSGHTVTGEAPATGTIDATYMQRDGTVDLRKLDLNMPASHFGARGSIGAYPLTSPTALAVDFHSGNLAEFDTVLCDLGLNANGKSGVAAMPVGLNGQADFRGNWTGSLESPHLDGQLQATQVALTMPTPAGSQTAPRVIRWDTIEAEGSYDAERIAVLHGQLQRGATQIAVDGTLSAAPALAAAPHKKPIAPAFDNNSILQLHAHATHVDAADLLPVVGIDAPITGTVDAQITAEGPVHNVGGSGWLQLNNGTVYGEPVPSLRLQGSLADKNLKLESATAKTNAGTISAEGTYDLAANRVNMEVNASGIELAKIERLRQAISGVTGSLSLHATVAGTKDDPRIEGHASVAGLTVQGQSLGALEINAHTANHALVYTAGTRYQAAEVSVQARTELRGDYSTEATLNFAQFDIGTIFNLANIQGIRAQSALSGTAQIAGPLAHPAELRGDLRLKQMAVTVAGVRLQSENGLHAALDNGRVSLDTLHITGEDTDLHAQGSVGLKDTQRIDFAASGSVNLKLAQTLDPDLTASGNTTFQVEAHGPLTNPDLRGRVEFHDGSLALEDLPNSLSQLRGTMEFSQNRLEIRSLTATTGGGQLSVAGYLAYQHGLYANLALTGRSVRIRYPSGVSSMADANLQLQGTQANLLLSGNVLITRFNISPTLDIASLAAQANAVQPVAPPNAPSNHVRLDVRIQSSPQLNFQNAYAKLAGDVDLRLRGTLATPSLGGRISITEGNATIAGTRYELQRGDITFTNPVRIQPNIDLSATARVEDYDISLGLHGTPDKMAVSYRSDPPLPEADVVALLALGRTQSSQGIYTEQQQQSAGASQSTDVLLGGALNATVSSRVQKLFGAGSVKVDPSYLGALGNSTTRITVEEQLGKNVTLTYATNVDTTAQQLLQAEIAINRHVSLQVTRDESGVFSMVIKAIRRYQ